MKPDFSAAPIIWVVILTLASQVACSTLNSGGGHIRRFSCDFQVYRDLMALRDPHICNGENQVWRMLDQLYHQTDGPSCMKQVIMHLGGQFVDVRHSPEYCNCSGSNTLHSYMNGPNLMEHRDECRSDHSYASLYDTHFMRHQHAHAYNCTSHHAIWHTLASIGSDTCRNDIVLHVANMFKSSGEQCSCGLKLSGKEVTQTIHTTNHLTTSTKGPTDHCLNYESYNYLHSLGLHVYQCVSVNNMWHYLADLQHIDVNCRKKIMDHMAAIFHDYSNSPTYCTCTGHDTRHNIVYVPHGNQTYCNKNHEAYRLLHRELYENSPSPCRSHQYLWKKLLAITIGQHETDCRADLILHAAATFPNARNDPCSCTNAATSLMISTTTRVAGPSTLSHDSTIEFTATSKAASTTSGKQVTEHLLGKDVTQTIHTTNHLTTSTEGTTDHCLNYESYKYLYNLGLHVHQCVSVNNMWHYLADLQHIDVNCRKKIIDHMAVIFHDYNNSPTYCTCTGPDIHHINVYVPNSDPEYCYRMHSSYRLLHNEIYAQSPSPCRSHQYLWQSLLNITIVHGERDCREDLILHAAATFPDPRNDPCSCTQVTVAAKSTSTSVISTTQSPTTTQQTSDLLLGFNPCDKASTMSVVLHNVTHAHPNASDCIPGDHKSSEALVFVNCNTSSTETWRKGENVMALCSRLPMFTPIATFKNDGAYTANGGRAGIFVGCLPDGFKFAVQDCQFGIQIKHLQTGGLFVNDPSNYYIIRW